MIKQKHKDTNTQDDGNFYEKNIRHSEVIGKSNCENNREKTNKEGTGVGHDDADSGTVIKSTQSCDKEFDYTKVNCSSKHDDGNVKPLFRKIHSMHHLRRVYEEEHNMYIEPDNSGTSTSINYDCFNSNNIPSHSSAPSPSSSSLSGPSSSDPASSLLPQHRLSSASSPVDRCDKIAKTKKAEVYLSDSDTEDVRCMIGGMRAIQKARNSRRRGVDAASAFLEKLKNEDEDEDETAADILNKGFSSQHNSNTHSNDPGLEAYLAANLPSARDSGEEKPEPVFKKTREELLYEVPEHLKVIDRSAEFKNQMNWVTGLVEVPLPVEARLKNIEATERAKRQLLRKGLLNEQGEDDEAPDAVRRQAFGQRFTWFVPDLHTKKNPQSSMRPGDDRALIRFTKRTKNINETKGRVGLSHM